MYCYTIKLFVYSAKMNCTATLIERVKSNTIKEIIEIYNETVVDATEDCDFIIISTSLQESLKD